MTYHTNHSWCSESNWDGKSFDGGVMVYFSTYLNNDFLRNNNERSIKDLDFDRLVCSHKLTVFDSEEYNRRVNLLKAVYEHLNKDFDENNDEIKKILDSYKEFNKITLVLNQEVLDWLDDNIQDLKGTDSSTPIHERKGWCIGSDYYNSREPYQFTVWFSRQKDALKFIEHWSVYKEPVFYFDYFHDDRRDLEIRKLISISNDYISKNGGIIIDIGDKINIHHTSNTNLNPDTFELIDWEVEEEDFED